MGRKGGNHMKHCPYCGKELDENMKFCSSCGSAQPQPQPQPQPQQPVYVVNNVTAPSRESTWDGGVFDTIVAALAASLIISFTCGIATPWAICYLMRFVVGHAVIDGKRLNFDGTGGQLFGQWLKWMLLSIITCGIYSLWVIPKMYQWICSHIHVH